MLVDAVGDNTLYAMWAELIVITITIDGTTKTVLYNGLEQSNSEYIVTYSVAGNPAAGLPAGLTLNAPADVVAKGTNAGTYTVSLQENQFSVTGDELFKYDVILDIIDPTVAVEITKRQLTLTSATDTKVYDGTPLTNNTVDVTGDGWANGEGATYDVTGTQTDVGMSDNTFTYSLNAGTLAENYDIEVKAGTLSVTEAPLVSVTVTKAWDDSNNEAGKRRQHHRQAARER